MGAQCVEKTNPFTKSSRCQTAPIVGLKHHMKIRERWWYDSTTPVLNSFERRRGESRLPSPFLLVWQDAPLVLHHFPGTAMCRYLLFLSRRFMLHHPAGAQ